MKPLSRRKFISVAASTAATSCLPLTGAGLLAAGSAQAAAASDKSDSRESDTPAPFLLVNPGYKLMIDPVKGTIASFRSTYSVDRELLIPGHVGLPLFKIEFMSSKGEFSTVTSSDAKEISVHRSANERDELIEFEFKQIGGLPVDGRATARCPLNETLTYWNLELKNGTPNWIGHVQFPVIEIPFDDLAHGNLSHILWPNGDGALSSPVQPSISDLWGGKPHNSPEAWRYNNYPGQSATAQLMAYYNDLGGLYLACDDPTGLPKFINLLIEDDGVTMGVGHYPATARQAEMKLPYNVVLGTFHGDWYAAAEIYRGWALKQDFCKTRLADRKDAPKWLGDSPIGITFPMRGEADWDGPAKENPEYSPATNALPYLEKLAQQLDSPLMPIIFNWEHAGPWVQPEAYPAVGGDAAMREFMAKAKEKGWHPVIYGDGLCWVTWQKNTGYDGLPYFHSHGGDAAVIRKWDGELFEYVWPWRKNYMVCVGTEVGRQMVAGMTRKMAEFGPDVIQQFDQGPGPMACYATDHGHPPLPGPWMTEAFNGLLKEDLKAARSVDPSVAMSCEGAPPETWLQSFQIWDARVGTCPLFSFLYHEFAHGHEGFYTDRVNDEALRLSVARAVVTGYMVNFTLRDKGQIEYDWDQTWTRAVPDQAAILDWAKRINRFRAGIAKDYLIYGRMMRPWTVSNVNTRDFGWGKEPLVQSATWQAQDGKIGVVLANYANLPESPRVELPGVGTKQLVLNIDGEQTRRSEALPCAIDLEMGPRSLALIEVI
jgi:hypothetical protein